MASMAEFQHEMVHGLRGKCISTIRANFRCLTVEDAEDCVQVALAETARVVNIVKDIESFVVNKAKLRAIDRAKEYIVRREYLPIHRVYTPRRKDPYRALDFRIDLERSIKRSVKGTLQRNAAWLVLYEGYTASEVAHMLPKERTVQAWEHVINRDVLPMVRKRMRRGGYRI
jgi:hypothetical protein